MWIFVNFKLSETSRITDVATLNDDRKIWHFKLYNRKKAADGMSFTPEGYNHMLPVDDLNLLFKLRKKNVK